MLHLHRVAKLFGLKAVLRNVSCTFAPGSITLLVGDNGAGKSTLLRMAAGLPARAKSPDLKMPLSAMWATPLFFIPA